MFKITAFLLAFVITATHAQVDSWGTGLFAPVDGVKSILGGESKCLSADREEYEFVDCEVKAYEYENPQLRTDFDHMTEELIFLEAARRTHQLTVCQGKLHKKYAQDPGTRSTMLQNAHIQFNAISQRLGELARRKTEVDENVRMYGSFSIEDRNTPTVAQWRLERLRPALVEQAQVNGEIQSLVSRIPMGNRPDMHEMLVNLARNNSSVSEAQFRESFDGVMGKLHQDVFRSSQFFDGIIKPKPDGGTIYAVNHNLKSALVKAGQIENVVTSLGMEERLADRFVCRTKARYIDGPRNLAMVEIPFYFAGAYGLGRLALRAGVYALRTGSTAVRAVAEGTRAAAQLGMVGLTALDLGIATEQVREACFPQEFLNGALDEQCTEETEVLGVYQEANIAQCVTTSALTVAPPAFVGVRGLTRLVRPTGIPSLSRALANSGKFRFFQSGRGEVRFTDQTLQPGVSYTVVIDDEGRIVLGTNYRNERGGFSGTHIDLLRDTGKEFGRRPPTYEGGTIHVNADGSFEVSGFRRKESSERSMRLIEDALRDVLPGATIRSTPGRLPGREAPIDNSGLFAQ